VPSHGAKRRSDRCSIGVLGNVQHGVVVWHRSNLQRARPPDTDQKG
jgi:hypothetical protein